MDTPIAIEAPNAARGHLPPSQRVALVMAALLFGLAGLG
jgi:hypothetical protein